MKFDFRDTVTTRSSQQAETLRRNTARLVSFFEGDHPEIPVRDILAKNESSVIFNRPHGGIGGHHEDYSGIIQISRRKYFPNQIHQDKIVTHELGHRISHQKTRLKNMRIRKRRNEVYVPTKQIARDRSYRGLLVSKSGLTSRITTVDQSHQYNHPSHINVNRLSFFRGFNEGLTDQIAREILSDEMTIDEFNAVDGNGYLMERAVLVVACESMARALHVPTHEIFKLFVHSYIYGWQPALKRAFLRAFGPNGLRVAAVMEGRGEQFTTNREHAHHTRKLARLFIPFFDTTVPKERREEIARQILKRSSIPYKT